MKMMTKKLGEEADSFGNEEKLGDMRGMLCEERVVVDEKTLLGVKVRQCFLGVV